MAAINVVIASISKNSYVSKFVVEEEAVIAKKKSRKALLGQDDIY